MRIQWWNECTVREHGVWWGGAFSLGGHLVVRKLRRIRTKPRMDPCDSKICNETIKNIGIYMYKYCLPVTVQNSVEISWRNVLLMTKLLVFSYLQQLFSKYNWWSSWWFYLITASYTSVTTHYSKSNKKNHWL